MHRVALVAPFVSSVEPELAALLTGDPYAIRDRLAALDGDWVWDRPDEGRVASLIDQHESTGASLLPARLLAGVLAEVPAELAQRGVTVVELSCGVHGVACLVVWADLLDLGDLASLETDLRPLVESAAGHLAQALRDLDGAVTHRSARGRYPRDSFLFWHRVLWSAATPAIWEQLMCDDVRVDSRAGDPVAMRVSDGYSAMTGGDDEAIRAMVGGLVRAQEHWLLTEAVGQQLLLEIAQLERVGTPSTRHQARALRAEESVAVRLAEREALRAGIVRDELRYLTGLRAGVLEACSRCWDMPLDTEPVRQRLEVLQTMLGRRVAVHEAARQDRLNAVVLALTVVGALSLVLGVFETAVGSEAGDVVGYRVLLAGAVALLAGAALAVALAGVRKNDPH